MVLQILDRQFIEAMIHGDPPIDQVMEDIQFMDDHLYNIFNQIRIQFPLITTELGITTRRQREAVLRAMIIAAQNGIMDFHQVALDTINIPNEPPTNVPHPRPEEQPRRNVRRRLMPHREESSVTDEDFIKNKSFDNESECYICYEPLINDSCMIRECGHVFHCDCINRWRLDMHKDTCPTCRGEIIRIIRTRTVSFGKKVQKKMSEIESDIKYLKQV